MIFYQNMDTLTESPVTISIITPSYNQASYLAATIESVLSQEGQFHLDYIIIDGNSSDGSQDIIKYYQGLLDRKEWPVGCASINLRWHSEPDEGQSDALSKGFCMAKGEIFAWLNSDDLYQAGTLQAITGAFRQSPAVALVYGGALYSDATGAILGRYPSEPFNVNRLAFFNFIPQPSTFFQKTAYQAVGGLDTSLHFAMDYDLTIRICTQFPIRYMPQILSHYRLHESAKTERADVLLKNHEEGLRVAIKYFSWAPLNRVYGCCACYCQQKLTALKQYRFLLIVISICCAISRSLWANRGINLRDLQLLNRKNFSKLFKSRREILLD